MTTRWRKAAMVVAMLVGLTGVAHAAPPTFRITQVFAAPNGYSQFVELTEYAGLDGQDRFTGLTLTMTGPQGVRTMTFRDDLPSTKTAHMSVIVWVTIPFDADNFYGTGGTAGYQGLPESFIDLRGGTLDFAGVDTFALPPVPVDGVNAVYRDQRIAPATLPSFCETAPCPREAHEETTAVVIEYHNYALGRFFLTANPYEIQALERGLLPGWKRSGGDLLTHLVPHGAYTTPVCRVYAPPALGDAHILSASAEECAALAQPGSGFVLETMAAFYVAMPDPATGACATGIPIHRYWNRAGGADHRYSRYKLDPTLSFFSALVSEGYGPDGVAFCTLEYSGEVF